jgi:hypothetical protein
MSRIDFGRLAASLLALAAASACSGGDEKLVCGQGTRLVGSTCAPVCSPGTEYDPASQACLASCAEGTHRDAPSGACLPDESGCAPGSVLDVSSGTCIAVGGLCGEDRTWVADLARCVPVNRLPEADFVEGEGENDPQWGGPSAFEVLYLPALGEAVSLSGTIEAPADRDNDGRLDPDLDYWLFAVEEPTLVRITGTGLGGSTAGFYVIGIDLSADYLRAAFGTRSTGVARDVFLPPGIFAFVASDALGFTAPAHGPFQGGGDMGYYYEIARRPLPEPRRLQLADGFVSVEGLVPDRVPAEGSSLGFFTLPVEARQAYDFSLRYNGKFLFASLTILDSTGLLGTSDMGRYGFLRDEEILVVVDYPTKLGFVDVYYDLQVARLASTWLAEEQHRENLVQEPWSYGQPVPLAYFGLEAAAGEVVTARVSSSTGWTCLEAWERNFNVLLANSGCVLGSEPAFDHALRLVAPGDGYFGLTSVDLLGAEIDLGSGAVVSIPRHPYELALAVRRQLPLPITDLSEPQSFFEQPLPEEDGERYFTLRAAPGQAVLGHVSGAGGPEIVLYEAGAGQLRPASPASAVFAFRSTDGEDPTLGVAHPDGTPGTFDLHVEPLEPLALGPVPVGVTSVTLVLPQGAANRFVRLLAREPGVAVVRLAPPTGLDLAVLPRAIDLRPLAPEPTDVSGPGGAETVVGAVQDDGLFFEVRTADGRPVDHDTELVVEIALAEANFEVEFNDYANLANATEAPAAWLGSIEAPGDVDWYRLETTGPTILTAATLPVGDRSLTDTVLFVGNRWGEILAFDDDSGPGAHARAEAFLDRAGIFTVAVRAFDPPSTGPYLLELQTRDP